MIVLLRAIAHENYMELVKYLFRIRIVSNIKFNVGYIIILGAAAVYK